MPGRSLRDPPCPAKPFICINSDLASLRSEPHIIQAKESIEEKVGECAN